MFSQNDEEAVVAGIFGGGHVGRFLDLAAYDGVTNSNTRSLALRGWGGVCVEPGPTAWTKLSDLYRGRADVRLVNAAVTVNGGPPVDFWESSGGVDGGGVSTLVPSHRKKWATSPGVSFTRTTVQQLSVTQLFDLVGYEFDFVSLDVEGMTLDLFRALPLDRLTVCRCLCVEHDGSEDWIAAAGSVHGYRVVSLNAENVVLAR